MSSQHSTCAGLRYIILLLRVRGNPGDRRHGNTHGRVAVAEAEPIAFNVLRVARAVQLRRLRMAAGSALVAAGSVARLRAASTEPSGNHEG